RRARRWSFPRPSFITPSSACRARTTTPRRPCAARSPCLRRDERPTPSFWARRSAWRRGPARSPRRAPSDRCCLLDPLHQTTELLVAGVLVAKASQFLILPPHRRGELVERRRHTVERGLHIAAADGRPAAGAAASPPPARRCDAARPRDAIVVGGHGP